MIRKNWQANLVFWGVFIILFLVYAYQEILFAQPYSMHKWRQADCISISMNFMEEKNPFCPSIHNYISDDLTSGKSVGEFTGVYYLMGRLWELFGVQLWMYRLFNILLMAFACFSLFRSLRQLWNDTFWSLFLGLLLFASPLIVFYTPNFLMDITALAFTVWGWALYLRYSMDGKRKQLIGAFTLFTLAALFKITAGITGLALLGVVGLEAIGLWKNVLQRTKLPWRTVLVGAISILVVFGWYYYASVHNAKHGGKYTFNDFWPLWGLSDEQVKSAVRFFSTFTATEFFHKGLMLLVLLMSLGGFFLALRKSSRIAVFLLFALTGGTLYVLCWFGALEGHDYYFINLLPLPLLMTGIFIHYRQAIGKKAEMVLKGVACVAFIFSVVYSASSIRLKFKEDLQHSKDLAMFFFSEEEYGYWTYMADNYKDRGLFTMEAYNRKLGIKRSDLVIILPDPSFNIALTRLNQKGWNNYGNDITMERFSLLKRKGAKYLIMNKNEFKDYAPIEPLMKDSIGYYESYTIYRL